MIIMYDACNWQCLCRSHHSSWLAAELIGVLPCRVTVWVSEYLTKRFAAVPTECPKTITECQEYRESPA